MKSDAAVFSSGATAKRADAENSSGKHENCLRTACGQHEGNMKASCTRANPSHKASVADALVLKNGNARPLLFKR